MEQAANKFVVFIELDGRRTHRNHKHALQLAKDGKGSIEGMRVQIEDESKSKKTITKKHKKK